MRPIEAFLCLAAFLVPSSCKCGDDRADSASVRRPPPDEHFAHAIVRKACAPDGGSALTLHLAAEGSGCGPFLSERIALFLFEHVPVTAPQRFQVGGTEPEATASHCPAGNEACRVAASGNVEMVVYEHERIAAGRWSLGFEDGSTKRGTFDAKWCPPLMDRCTPMAPSALAPAPSPSAARPDAQPASR